MKTNVLLNAVLLALVAAGLVTSVALADPPTPSYPGNSEPGIGRYLEISEHPNDNAQCGTGAGSGSFGYFGHNLNLGIKTDPSDPGANGYQTGLNNSAVCGNR